MFFAYLLARVRALAGKSHYLFRLFESGGGVIGIKLTGLAGCVGLRQESVIFLDILKVEILDAWISGLNWHIFMVFPSNSPSTGSVCLSIDSSRS